MPYEASNRYELYFDDPRLRMTVAGRFVVRVITNITYLILLFGAGTFLISEAKPIRYSGIFIVLFLLDYAAHWGEADLSIAELPPKGKINLARIVRPSAFSAMSRAFDRGLVAKRDFFLSVTDRLMGLPHIEERLRRLGVPPMEFKAKLAEFLKKQVPSEVASRAEYLKNAEALTTAAFRAALVAGHNFIEPIDFFSALATTGSESAIRLFNLFSIEAGGLNAT